MPEQPPVLGVLTTGGQDLEDRRASRPVGLALVEAEHPVRSPLDTSRLGEVVHLMEARLLSRLHAVTVDLVSQQQRVLLAAGGDEVLELVDVLVEQLVPGLAAG